MTNFLYYNFAETGTTVVNHGTGGSVYNGTVSRDLRYVQPNGYPAWGNYTAKTDFICIHPQPLQSNVQNHTWEFAFYYQARNGTGITKLWDKDAGAIYIMIHEGANNIQIIRASQISASDVHYWQATTTQVVPGHTYYVALSWNCGTAGSPGTPACYIGTDTGYPTIQTMVHQTEGSPSGAWFNDSVGPVNYSNYASGVDSTPCSWQNYGLIGRWYMMREYDDTYSYSDIINHFIVDLPRWSATSPWNVASVTCNSGEGLVNSPTVQLGRTVLPVGTPIGDATEDSSPIIRLDMNPVTSVGESPATVSPTFGIIITNPSFTAVGEANSTVRPNMTRIITVSTLVGEGVTNSVVPSYPFNVTSLIVDAVDAVLVRDTDRAPAGANVLILKGANAAPLPSVGDAVVNKPTIGISMNLTGGTVVAEGVATKPTLIRWFMPATAVAEGVVNKSAFTYPSRATPATVVGEAKEDYQAGEPVIIIPFVAGQVIMWASHSITVPLRVVKQGPTINLTAVMTKTLSEAITLY